MTQYNFINRKAPGVYKKQRNATFSTLPSTKEHIIRRFVAPEDVRDQMAELMFWFRDNEMNYHAAVVAAVIGYNIVRIHPFPDTNGRTSRLLMAMVLLGRRYSPVIIQVDRRKEYMHTLAYADETGDILPFVDFVLDSLIHTQEGILTL